MTYKVQASLGRMQLTKPVTIDANAARDAGIKWLALSGTFKHYTAQLARHDGFTHNDDDTPQKVFRMEAIDRWGMDSIVVWVEEIK